jgi:hypothetical protein
MPAINLVETRSAAAVSQRATDPVQSAAAGYTAKPLIMAPRIDAQRASDENPAAGLPRSMAQEPRFSPNSSIIGLAGWISLAL